MYIEQIHLIIKEDKRGVDNLFSSVCKASNLYYEDEVIDSSWKQDLEDYIQDNEEKI